jgi:hypothetical protein
VLCIYSDLTTMANNSIVMQNFGDLESSLNNYLSKYNLILDDINIQSRENIDDFLIVIKNMIDTQFQKKLAEKRTAFDLQLRQFLYMYDVYCSDKCRESVLPRCISFLHKFGLHFNDFVVSNVSSATCIMTMLEKILIRLFAKKIESRTKVFQEEKDQKLTLLKIYLEERVASLIVSSEILQEESAGTRCAETECLEIGSRRPTFSDILGSDSSDEEELISVQSVNSDRVLLSRTNSETNINKCMQELQKLNDQCCAG